jgi:hypothetical protein
MRVIERREEPPLKPHKKAKHLVFGTAGRSRRLAGRKR